MKKLALLLILVLSVNLIHAQQTIKGQILDASNAPFTGATIQVKNTQRGTYSDANGNFSIMASPTDSLMISMIGMVPQTILVGERTTINVTLATEIMKVPEVVVIGYGTVKKSDLT